VQQLTQHIENRTANIFQIVDEIAVLEGVTNARSSGTKSSSQFNGKWLNGLWHKHYAQARFLPTNLKNHWTPAKLRQLIKETLGERDLCAEQAAKNLSHRYVLDGYFARSSNRELTGEWIVFAKQDSKVYYLTLAAHVEKDEDIWRRCKACSQEFPELEIIQKDR
jgi:hypothetical protein